MDKVEIAKQLQAPFPPEEIEWRIDRGQKTQNGNFVFVLAYVTNRAIMNRLDEVFGPFGWRNEFKEWKGTSQLCGISVWDAERSEWVTKWDGSDDSNMDKVKGGISGAMKRTAVQWGIGRYLYNLEQNRVPLKQSGENYAIVKIKTAQNQPDDWIRGYWDTPTLPTWALPSGFTGPQKSAPVQENQDESTALTDADLAAIEQQSNALTGKSSTPPTNTEQNRRGQSQGSSPAMARVYKLRERIGMPWPELNKLAGTILGREIKFLKSHVKTNEEWELIEQALKEAAA